MNVTKIIDAFGYVIYAALAFLAVWGVYNGILLYRSLGKKSLNDPEPLIDQVRELCQARQVRRGRQPSARAPLTGTRPWPS